MCSLGGPVVIVAGAADELGDLVLGQRLLLPDNLLLLQEYFPHDPEKGIVRMEFLDGKLLYAMRVISHGRFNLCPSEVCNPTAPPEKNSDQPTLQQDQFGELRPEQKEKLERVKENTDLLIKVISEMLEKSMKLK